MSQSKEPWTITITRKGDELRICTFTEAYKPDNKRTHIPSVETAQSSVAASEHVLLALQELCPDL